MVQHRYTTDQIPAGMALPGTLLRAGDEIFRVDSHTVKGENGVQTIVLEQHTDGIPPWVVQFDPDELVTRMIRVW